MNVDLMVDIETLGSENKHTVPIISIAARKFSFVNGTVDTEYLYREISLKSAVADGVIEYGTLNWQLTTNRTEFLRYLESSKNGVSTLIALQDFVNYIPKERGYNLWAQGKDFDLPILQGACNRLGVKFTTPYYKFRCSRDYQDFALFHLGYTKNAGKEWLDSNVTRKGTYHNAIDDVDTQIAKVLFLKESLFKLTSSTKQPLDSE